MKIVAFNLPIPSSGDAAASLGSPTPGGNDPGGAGSATFELVLSGSSPTPAPATNSGSNAPSSPAARGATPAAKGAAALGLLSSSPPALTPSGESDSPSIVPGEPESSQTTPISGGEASVAVLWDPSSVLAANTLMFVPPAPNAMPVAVPAPASAAKDTDAVASAPPQQQSGIVTSKMAPPLLGVATPAAQTILANPAANISVTDAPSAAPVAGAAVPQTTPQKPPVEPPRAREALELAAVPQATPQKPPVEPPRAREALELAAVPQTTLQESPPAATPDTLALSPERRRGPIAPAASAMIPPSRGPAAPQHAQLSGGDRAFAIPLSTEALVGSVQAVGATSAESNGTLPAQTGAPVASALHGQNFAGKLSPSSDSSATPPAVPNHATLKTDFAATGAQARALVAAHHNHATLKTDFAATAARGMRSDNALPAMPALEKPGKPRVLEKTGAARPSAASIAAGPVPQAEMGPNTAVLTSKLPTVAPVASLGPSAPAPSPVPGVAEAPRPISQPETNGPDRVAPNPGLNLKRAEAQAVREGALPFGAKEASVAHRAAVPSAVADLKAGSSFAPLAPNGPVAGSAASDSAAAHSGQRPSAQRAEPAAIVHSITIEANSNPTAAVLPKISQPSIGVGEGSPAETPTGTRHDAAIVDSTVRNAEVVKPAVLRGGEAKHAVPGAASGKAQSEPIPSVPALISAKAHGEVVVRAAPHASPDALKPSSPVVAQQQSGAAEVPTQIQPNPGCEILDKSSPSPVVAKPTPISAGQRISSAAPVVARQAAERAMDVASQLAAAPETATKGAVSDTPIPASPVDSVVDASATKTETSKAVAGRAAVPSRVLAPAPAANPSGTLDAQQQNGMALTADSKVLSDGLGKNLPLTGKNDSTVREVEQILPRAHETEWSRTRVVSEIPLAVSESLRPHSERGDVEAEVTAALRPAAAKVASEVWSAVQSFRAIGLTDWEAKIRADQGTQLSLTLRMQDNQLVVHAKVEGGNWETIAPHWRDLQTVLAERGVQLRPLETPTQNGGTNSGHSQQFHSYQFETGGHGHRDATANFGRERDWQELIGLRKSAEPVEEKKPAPSPVARSQSDRVLETWA